MKKQITKLLAKAFVLAVFLIPVTSYETFAFESESSASVSAVSAVDCSTLPTYPSGRGTYVGGTRVTNIGNVYEAKPWPFIGWANSTNSAYAPGVGFAWQDAWIYIDVCGSSNPTPAAPTNLAASVISTSQINLSWTDNSTNETSFQVERSLDGSAWAPLSTLNANTTTYSNTGLAANTKYYYRVYAKNASGNSGYSNVVNATTQSGTVTVPAAPANLSASVISSSQINISWSDNSNNETLFRIERSANGSTWASLTTVAANVVSYQNTGLTASTVYYYRVRAENSAGNSSYTNVVNATTLSGNTNGTLPPRLLVGYWHNFDNGLTPFIRLKDVSTKWDVLNVSFIETAGDYATATFTPYKSTEADFIADVAYLKSLGKKVVISIGGQNGVLMLSNVTAKQNFINSMKVLIDKYGFNGIDLDVETGISLGAGDTDFKNPTSPVISNLISAVRTLCDYYGSNFILSMAPQIADVQGGIVAYGSNWGCYLPIIYGLRDKLTYIHVQHYNCGGNPALDGKNYNQGTADFQVAMAEMLLKGFPIAGNTNNMFPALRADQVMVGIPAAVGAAPSGGYINPTEMKKALDYIIKGTSYGGTYKLQNTSGYSAFRGVMTWSVNWDVQNNYEFTNNYRPYFDNLKSAEVATSVTDYSLSSNQFDLQNYPNPFALSTTISYYTQNAGMVVLKVYNASGAEIKTLVNENQLSGGHSVIFKIANLESGVYFCTLKANGCSVTKKMVVVK